MYCLPCLTMTSRCAGCWLMARRALYASVRCGAVLPTISLFKMAPGKYHLENNFCYLIASHRPLPL
jgi:hypothetical protein